MSFGDILGSAVSAIGSFAGLKSANRANRQLAGRQMDFQKDMSNSAYQRSMADMKKAGLNPILAYQQGGASSPAGATANMQDAITPAINSANTVSRTRAEIDNLRAQNAQINSQTILNEALQKSATADALLKVNSAKKVAVDADLASHLLPNARLQSKMDTSEFGEFGRKVERFINTINPFANNKFFK